ncbi:hypothetical protein [Caulobacter sp.]|uniref:hypothetical protein n=1 Tax=Caulobacter sp. TaxID=78 RepID=UPI002B4781C4|nr:hypothetical protein [Caulobacter sp.]HJV43022.1 hypothetical protein [Caulobacter sp.]
MRSPKSFSLEQVAFAAVLTIVPLLLCGFMFGFDIPLATAKFWSLPKGDMAAMTTAYEAYVRQPWTFPITMVSGLTPAPVSIVFSDSVPWLSVVLKASGLGPLFNPMGVFLMLSYPLQAWSMVALLRGLGVTDRAPLLIGGLFALLFPAWIARQFGHIALSGHWVILLALAVTVSSIRFGLTWRRVGLFAALAALATGIHAYHLVPVGAGFGAALLSELLQRRNGAWTRVPAAALAVVAATLLAAFVLGYGGGTTASGGAAALGYYSMNVLGPVWPQASKVFGQDWLGGWFRGTLDPNGGQYFEGFQFLGVGALALIAIMLAPLLLDAAAHRRPKPVFWLRWGPLILIMTALAAWAVGWNVYVGKDFVAAVPKPSGKLADMISVYRAHGRFFWTPGYLLLAVAISQVSRLPRRIGLALLSLALVVQAYDSSELRQGVRTTFGAPDTLDMPPAFAASPAIRGRPWVFRPSYHCSLSQIDLRAIGQMVLVAERAGGTTNTFGTARSNDAPCEDLQLDLTRDAAPGDRRITVVTSNGQLEGGALQPFAQRSDCYRFKRGVICGRDLGGIEGLAPVAPGALAATHEPVTSIRLDQPPRPAALISGWAELDPGGKGIWTNGAKAMFTLNAPETIRPSGFYLEVVATAFSDEPLRPQRVTLYANEHRLETQNIEVGAFNSYHFTVPANVVAPGQPVWFMFELPDARTSAVDPRKLGIAVQELKVLK